VAVGAVSYVGEVLREFHFWSIPNPATVVETRVAERSSGDSRQLTAHRPRQRFSGTGVCYVNTRVDGAVALRFRSGRPTVQRFFTRLPLPGE
jgi:hypothetical protein